MKGLRVRPRLSDGCDRVLESSCRRGSPSSQSVEDGAVTTCGLMETEFGIRSRRASHEQPN